MTLDGTLTLVAPLKDVSNLFATFIPSALAFAAPNKQCSSVYYGATSAVSRASGGPGTGISSVIDSDDTNAGSTGNDATSDRDGVPSTTFTTAIGSGSGDQSTTGSTGTYSLSPTQTVVVIVAVAGCIGLVVGVAVMLRRHRRRQSATVYRNRRPLGGLGGLAGVSSSGATLARGGTVPPGRSGASTSGTGTSTRSSRSSFGRGQVAIAIPLAGTNLNSSYLDGDKPSSIAIATTASGSHGSYAGGELTRKAFRHGTVPNLKRAAASASVVLTDGGIPVSYPSESERTVQATNLNSSSNTRKSRRVRKNLNLATPAGPAASGNLATGSGSVSTVKATKQ